MYVLEQGTTCAGSSCPPLPAPHFCPCQVSQWRQRLVLLCCEVGCGSAFLLSGSPCSESRNAAGQLFSQGLWEGGFWAALPGGAAVFWHGCVVGLRLLLLLSPLLGYKWKGLSFAVSPGKPGFSSKSLMAQHPHWHSSLQHRIQSVL